MDSRIRVVIRLIGEEYEPTMIGNLLGLSKTRLRRLFKREVGKTLNQYLREVKMARAVKLVERPNLPIKEIALTSGYNDVSNFYRDFRKIHGITPLQLRARQLKAFSDSEELLPSALDPVRYPSDPD